MSAAWSSSPVPEISPFSAIRYETGKLENNLSSVLAPPYDVLDESDKQALLARNSRNIVAIDLPHAPAKEPGRPEDYEKAATLLREWISNGTLIREARPALYVYHQRFRHENRNYSRRMFIARARLTPFHDGPILPHERTFGGPKEDRLALMRATRCNLSPIFGIYSDAERVVDAAFSSVIEKNPDVFGHLDHTDNLVWAVTDAEIIGLVVRAMADRKVYIADGHHRYETALRYRDEAASGDRLPRDHPAGFVMIVLACMEDPGCLILPYHRVLANIDVRTLLQAWHSGVHPAPPESADLVIQDGRSQDRAWLRFTAREQLSRLEPAQPAAWHRLDTAYLHRYLIDELLRAKVPDRSTAVAYVKSSEEAVRTARRDSGVALLLNPTPMAQLRAVAEAGALMPQKSTYFHPKLATGLTIYSLE